MSNFETMARRLRYQALGKACRARKVDVLAFAHHSDDQVETVISRLLRGARGTGLRGMKDVTQFPECHGMYGVSLSGGAATEDDHISLIMSVNDSGLAQYAQSRNIVTIGTPIDGQSQNATLMSCCSFETGGIQIIRPLLNFTKIDLIQICTQGQVTWFEDTTNADPSLTLRNTIRHLSPALPDALSSKSIHEQLQRLHDYDNWIRSKVTLWLATAQSTEFSPESGTLRVRFVRQSNAGLMVDCPLLDKVEVTVERVVREINIRRLQAIISLVGSIRDGQPDVEKLYQAVFPTEDNRPHDSNSGVATVQVSNVACERVDVCKSPVNEQDEDHEWFIYRRPPTRAESQVERYTISAMPKASAVSSSWILFDNRFWIQIMNRSSNNLILRHFANTDPPFASGISHEYRRLFRSILKSLAPRRVLLGLPVIVMIEDTSKAETIIAFPTLGLRLPGYVDSISWEVRYKQPDEVWFKHKDSPHNIPPV